MLYLAFTLLSLAAVEPSLRFTNVRPTTVGIRQLLVRGVERSETLRILVTHLERSDVVVYLYEEQRPQANRDGRLQFLAAAGGFRYVQVHLKLGWQDSRNISTLAHELQHAMEIAERPWIVDEASLTRAYREIGHRGASSATATRTFDTIDAVRVGQQVQREVMRTSASRSSSARLRSTPQR